MSCTQYLLHKKWSESCDLRLTNQEEEMDSSSSSCDDFEKEMDTVSGYTEKKLKTAVTCWDICQNSHCQKDDSKALKEQKTETVSHELSWEQQEDDLILRTGSNAVTRNFAKDSWKDAEIDEGFWRTESVSKIETTNVKDNWDDGNVDNICSTETAVDNTKHLDKRDCSDLSDIKGNISDELSTNLETGNSVQCRVENKVKSDIVDDTQIKKDIQQEDDMDKETNGYINSDPLDEENGVFKTSEINKELDQSHDVGCSEQLTGGELESMTDHQTVKINNKADVHHACKTNDSGGDTFVIDDSDSDRERRKKRKRIHWIPAIKKNPYIITEDLRLSLEEVRMICWPYFFVLFTFQVQAA